MEKISVELTSAEWGSVIEALLAAAADAAALADEDFGGMADTLRLASSDLAALADRLQAETTR